MKKPTSTHRPEMAMTLVTGMRIERTTVVDIEKICRWFQQILKTFLGPFDKTDDIVKVRIEVAFDRAKDEDRKTVTTQILQIHDSVQGAVKDSRKIVDETVAWFRNLISLRINASEGEEYFGTMRGDVLTVSFSHPSLRRKDVNALPSMPLTKKFAGAKSFSEVPTTTAETFSDRSTRATEHEFLAVGRRHVYPQGLGIEIVASSEDCIEAKIITPYGGWMAGERVSLERQVGKGGIIYESDVWGKAVIVLRGRSPIG